MEDKIFSIIFNEDEITWKTLLLELIKTEQMDPWDIDISLLAKKYISMVKKLKEHDFRMSGKVVLAAAILLRMQSTQLVEEDMAEFDLLLAGESEGGLLDGLEDGVKQRMPWDRRKLIPKTPQPRKRKVSIHDLIEALQKALEVSKRRFMNQANIPKMEVPQKKFDITEMMSVIFQKILNFFNGGGKKLLFHNLVPKDTKEAKVHTFIPLLHLSNERKVNINQEEHFGDIEITLRSHKDADKELAEV